VAVSVGRGFPSENIKGDFVFVEQEALEILGELGDDGRVVEAKPDPLEHRSHLA
jgi:hypothetical protein